MNDTLLLDLHELYESMRTPCGEGCPYCEATAAYIIGLVPCEPN